MAQPFDRSCQIEAKGKLDVEAGEFWMQNPFEMMSRGANLSAYERNRFFLNRDGQQFIDLSHESAADLDSDSRSAIVADFDRDGAPDLLVASVGGGPLRLFRNRIPSGAHRLQLTLKGTVSNSFGIGSQVTVRCGELRMVRDVFPASGLMGQMPVELNVGLGQADKIDELVVRWPTGETQTFADLPVNHRIRITEGESQPELLNASPGT